MSSFESVDLQPIGRVESTRRQPTDDDWDAEQASIVLGEDFGAEALAGLESFSHVEVIFLFDRVLPEKIERSARRPRGRSDWPEVGIFAQRAKNRPNRIGATICRVLQREGRRLHVAGLDAIDGTPVLDLKPVLREFLPRGSVRQPAWATELMRGYWDESPPPAGAPFVVLYRWRLKAGAEEAFAAAWSKVTEFYREHHGSLGSRLHLGSDGLWYGYAQWPSAEAREEAFAEGRETASGGGDEASWWEAMHAAVEESLPEVVLSTRADFLVLPRS